MAEQTIACPQCKHQVKVPEELLGEEVQCPACRSHFTAPMPGAEGRLTEPTVTQAGPSAAYTREQALIQVRWPGVGLLITGLLGLTANGYLVWLAEMDPDRLKKMTEMTEGIIQPAPPEDNEEGGEGEGQPKEFDPEQIQRMGQVMGWIFLAGSVLTVVAAICTLTLRLHWLAFTGGILATVNFGNCCCVLGLPMGLWVIVNLTDADVKQHFR